MFGYTPAQIRKFLIAAAGAVVIGANELLKYNDLLPPQVSSWVNVIVAIGTAAGVGRVPNAPMSPLPPSTGKHARPVI